jgi:hypothetical protein
LPDDSLLSERDAAAFAAGGDRCVLSRSSSGRQPPPSMITCVGARARGGARARRTRPVPLRPRPHGAAPRSVASAGGCDRRRRPLVGAWADRAASSRRRGRRRSHGCSSSLRYEDLRAHQLPLRQLRHARLPGTENVRGRTSAKCGELGVPETRQERVLCPGAPPAPGGKGATGRNATDATSPCARPPRRRMGRSDSWAGRGGAGSRAGGSDLGGGSAPGRCRRGSGGSAADRLPTLDIGSR